MVTRRTVLAGLGAAAATRLAWLRAAASAFEPALYPPMDLSRFDTPVTPAPAEIRIGYASITWGGHDAQAIEDIAALGYEGVQLRSNILPDWESRPQALADLLAAKRLTFVALSSGGVDIEKPAASEIAAHVAHASFLRAARGKYLQCTDTRPKRALARADYERLGKLLTQIGKRTADLGIALGYHNHMGTIGERPEEVAQILDAADPRYVKFELDIAHYAQGGGDPVKAIRSYGDRLLFLHVKDVEDRPGGSGAWGGAGGYRFVELGRGKVDVKGCFAALHEVKFRGWAVVELDAVPDNARTPKDAAAVNKQFLHTIGAL
ncbi:MAG: xylose isomerase [Acidobacteria bacterium]|nr:MAG: xylose isomerase [Acidobacteriota bacterium]